METGREQAIARVEADAREWDDLGQRREDWPCPPYVGV
jgi:hypothetical protein